MTRCHRTGREGLHLDARAIEGVDLGLDLDVVVPEFEVDEDGAHHDRVAQRQEVAGPFGRLNAGDPGHGEHITLRHGPLSDQAGGLGLHVDPTPGHRPSSRGFLRGDVDHAGVAQRVEVGQAMFGHPPSLGVSHRAGSCPSTAAGSTA